MIARQTAPTNMTEIEREMTTSAHPFRELTIHECVLDAAQSVLSQAAGGLELPGFSTYVKSADEDGENKVIKVSYNTACGGEVLCDVDRHFLLDENVFKGIAQGREQDVSAFMKAFLPTYRSLIVGSYIDYVIGRSSGLVDLEDSSINHDGFAEDIKRFDGYLGPWTTPWELAGASAESASEDWFELRLRFENPEISDTYSSESDAAFDYDGREFTIPISWEDYLGARNSEEGMHALLKRIHGAFVVIGDQASGYYSSYAHELIDRLERLADKDDSEEECPFASGELVFDSDGRVHASSDLA